MSETEVEAVQILRELGLTPKQFKALMNQLQKLERRDLLDVSGDPVLEAREKLLIYGVRLGMDFAAINKKAWALGVGGLLWGFGLMFFWIGLMAAAL